MARITDSLNIKPRYILILFGILIFLPPLALIPQIAGEPNMCGKVCPRMFFILSPNGVMQDAVSNIEAMWVGAMLALTILIVTFFFGRLWCSHICPIGGFTEIVSRLLPKRLKINYSWIESPPFRYGYFAIFIAGAYAGIGSIACKLCNYRVIPFLVGSPFEPAYITYLSTSMGLAGLLTVSVTGFFAKGGRAYCNLLCPVGAVDSLVNFVSSRLGITKKVRTDESKCDGCGKCIGSCMVWALKPDERQKIKRDVFSCISCRECENICPKGAISYGKHKI